MREISKKQNQLSWASRILLTIDVLLLVNGYIAFFQAKYQLISPLIPENILIDVTMRYMKASLISGVPFLAGLWFYTFDRKIASIVLWSVTAIIYEIILYSFTG